MFLFNRPYVFLWLVACLSACGGGGGGSSNVIAPTDFGSITNVPASFNWSTNKTRALAVTVNRASGSVGAVQVRITSAITTDPSDSSVLLARPKAGDGIVWLALGLPDANGTLPSWTTQTANFGNVTLPVSTTQVLVQVIDITNPGNGILATSLVNVADFSNGLTLSI